MSKKVIIIGAGGHGKVIADIVKRSGDEIAGYLDDQKTGVFNGYRILGTTKAIGKWDGFYFAAVGNNRTRQSIMNRDVKWYSAIHPSAVIAEDVVLREGIAIMANAVINAGSQIGRGAIINTAATVDHDCVIKEFAHISPGVHLAGTVTVGERTWLGISAAVINNATIGNDVVIGAGAVVLDSINAQGTYLGIPAKKS